MHRKNTLSRKVFISYGGGESAAFMSARDLMQAALEVRYNLGCFLLDFQHRECILMCYSRIDKAFSSGLKEIKSF